MSEGKLNSGRARSLGRGIALAALAIAVGNIASRLLGLVRDSTIAFYFGRGAAVDAYTAAWQVPNTVYDFLINGAISAALVPVFSAYAESDEDEFWKVGSGIINLAMLVLLLITGLMLWQTPGVINLLVQQSQVELREETIALTRLMLPAVPLMGLSGLITALLYARQRFLFPAFVTAVFNLGIIMGAMLFHQRFDVRSLAIGVLIGALAQVMLQLPGLRGMRYHFSLGLKHPGTRRVLTLYAPVALGMGFSVVGIVIDRWLASGFESALSTMRYATTLIQFPLGLVATAVSTAVLPTLSRQETAADEEGFRRTLGMGIKVVLLLIIPACVGLMMLAQPIVALLFERGQFSAQDSAATALALLCYLPGLPAAAIDQMLLFAFYARKNTLVPNLVQGAAILIYLLTVLPLIYLSDLGYLSLVLGNSAQWIGHMLLLLFLARRFVTFGGLRIGEALLKTLAASALMAAAIWGLLALTSGSAWLGLPLVQIVLAGSLGAALYFACCLLLKVESLSFFVNALMRRIGRRTEA